jgi:serine/threonine protein kinase
MSYSYNLLGYSSLRPNCTVFVQENSWPYDGSHNCGSATVSGVEKIHAMNVVHRDLKPAAKLQSAVDDVQEYPLVMTNIAIESGP